MRSSQNSYLITRIVVLSVVITVVMTTTIVTVAGPCYRELRRIPLLGNWVDSPPLHRRFIRVRYAASNIALSREVRELTFASVVLHYCPARGKGVMLSLAILQETAGATSAPTTAGNWLPSAPVIGTLLVIAILVVAVVGIWSPPDWQWIPGGKTTIQISAVVIVILTVIYLVPGVASVLASVLGSVGPTFAALITAVLAFLGVLLAQIVTVSLFGFGLLRDLRSKQERDEEEQPRENIRAQENILREEDILRETIRAQEDILDRSLDRITNLLSSVPLREPILEGVDRRAAARAWALTALARLDRDHKKILLQFLHAANLIKKEGTDGHEQPVIILRGADLSGANLDDADLSGDSLNGTNLSGATLRNADLSNADLSDAKGVTNEQLSATRSLEGATMPDGQTLKSDDNPDGPTFEDWLKDREDSGKDVENE